VRRSKLQRRLEEERQVPGLFRPAGADFETPAVLTWSAETGGALELVDMSDPWPADFEETFTVHGKPHEGEPVTLLRARVRKKLLGDRTSHVVGWTLALGDHVHPGDRWPVATYRPGTLHEWLPETGLSIEHPHEDMSRLVVEWNAPERRTVALPDAEIALSPGADWTWAYSPGWSIDTSMTFSVKPIEPLTIDEHRELFGNPLISFAVFAADHPDDFARESYYDPDSRRGIVVLEHNRKPAEREWRPNPGHLLFGADDLPNVAGAFENWFAVWRRTFPALGLLRESIEQGLTYSVPRFLTLFTAAEGYWKGTRVGKSPWSPRALADRAGISPEITKASKEALALLGATREYHAHLGTKGDFEPEFIIENTYESTRRLQVLLQACLMQDLGVDVATTERLLSEHYRSWPIP
jgi:hypothetical protein